MNQVSGLAGQPEFLYPVTSRFNIRPIPTKLIGGTIAGVHAPEYRTLKADTPDSATANYTENMQRRRKKKKNLWPSVVDPVQKKKIRIRFHFERPDRNSLGWIMVRW